MFSLLTFHSACSNFSKSDYPLKRLAAAAQNISCLLRPQSGSFSIAFLSSSFRSLAIGVLVSAGTGGALAEDPPSNFYCKEKGRFLTDLEFLESAFAYEVKDRDLPEPYLSLGISGMQKIDPGCCQVLREDNPFYEPWTWLDRLLFDPPVYVLIGWDLDPHRGATNGTKYDMSVCGKVIERRGDFRKRDFGR